LRLAHLRSHIGITATEFRIPGIVAAMRRVLNVEGYAVLAIDDASGSIVLNRQLLQVQFELEAWDVNR
jgi:phosphoenolpyruvate-protein kinase (PTS system EI component)